ncbi:uncharacterized protein LOC142980410 isoform X2 [Anticarsia gemmatalis]|uniref:uncharacterized protein LOC142980410 isoform X2 n=1 Tax=Anticarsia gemmatalis TaxID=129554 RepID=UPI003F76B3B6
MESGVTQECTQSLAGVPNVVNTESVENFQKFIYELFEKNGILNDLRAYLRGHIVNVLRSAQTGDPPVCQKNFRQRLELTFQALNILIAEYLLRLEFSYSLSVFVSEIPLANMVFGFAKSLMEKTYEDKAEFRFKDNDVWSILNYLGIQCDSVHASKIIQMYSQDQQSSLLLCILKCVPLYQKETVDADNAVSSEENLSISAGSSDTIENREGKSHQNPCGIDKCKHLAFCKTCQRRMAKLKEKYNKKKKGLYKNFTSNSNTNNTFNVENLMKNIGVLERSLIDEMFQQLKSVYETEVEMVKVEEEKRVKRSMASHALQLQKQRDELEESFKARSLALERGVAQKKQFLWGLASALRDQHLHLTRAMRDVRAETDRLTAKEDSLKSQLAEAEEVLKKRGEEMRSQISQELVILEGHLASMKKERENINKERNELESMKKTENSSTKVLKIQNMDSEELHSHYDLLRNELALLKKYLESSKMTPKCVIERGTITELSNVTSRFQAALNNSPNVEKSKEDFDDRLKNQVVNDFKKKNVNFCPSNLDEIYREQSRSRSRSSSSEAGDNARPLCEHARELVDTLRDENARLKAMARQESQQLCVGGCVCQSRPHTAPAHVAARSSAAVATHTTFHPQYFLHSMNTSVSANTVSVGWRKGAGEELSMFSDAQPRILVPGDSIPFVGVLRDRERHPTSRRQLLSQWRALRGRTFPHAGVSKRTPSPHREKPGSSGQTAVTTVQQASCSSQPTTCTHAVRDKSKHRSKPATLEINKKREKSPKSVLREAKEKLRNIKDTSIAAREKSPTSVLREAKLRLRKLEIEAEAVEKSYLDFRRKQSQLRLERNNTVLHKDDTVTNVVSVDNKLKNSSQSLQKLENTRSELEAPLTDYEKYIRNDFDKYLREYQTKFDLGETHFKNKTTVDNVKPIPEVYSQVKEYNVETNDNYLETPLIEFRKLYYSNREIVDDDSASPKQLEIKTSEREITKFEDSTPGSPRLKRHHHSKTSELEILKQNITKMYNLSDENVEPALAKVLSPTLTKDDSSVEEQNLLKVEVESVQEVKVDEQDLVLVIQNSTATREVILSRNNSPINISAQMTMIVSPKDNGPKGIENSDIEVRLTPVERSKRSSSPEQEAHLTRNDVLDAIFHADTDDQKSSTVIPLEMSKDVLEHSVSDFEKKECYTDDFSGDVDNYNSRSEMENSPLSLVKTSEDDNFWD